MSDLPTTAAAVQAGFFAAAGAGFFIGIRWCARWLKDQIVDGVDERTNGRIQRQINERCDELEKNVDARLAIHESNVGGQTHALIEAVEHVAAGSRVTARVLARHVRWATSQVDHDYPDPAVDDVDDLLEAVRPRRPPEAP